MTLAIIRRPIGTQRPKLSFRSDGPIFENLLFSLWQYDLRVNTSLISLIAIQGKNAAEHTFVCAVHESAGSHPTGTLSLIDQSGERSAAHCCLGHQAPLASLP
jgi:hypothetical protein